MANWSYSNNLKRVFTTYQRMRANRTSQAGTCHLVFSFPVTYFTLGTVTFIAFVALATDLVSPIMFYLSGRALLEPLIAILLSCVILYLSHEWLLSIFLSGKFHGYPISSSRNFAPKPGLLLYFVPPDCCYAPLSIYLANHDTTPASRPPVSICSCLQMTSLMEFRLSHTVLPSSFCILQRAASVLVQS